MISAAGRQRLPSGVRRLFQRRRSQQWITGVRSGITQKNSVKKNARIEGIADRVTFQKGDAAKLDFADGTFDAAVSNFVFHEVHSAKDKRDVVREALRVLKKGGAFSFQDMFSQEALYGDMDAFVKQLKAEGISEIHYIGNLEKKLDAIPGYVTTPWMISGMGIIYGKK